MAAMKTQASDAVIDAIFGKDALWEPFAKARNPNAVIWSHEVIEIGTNALLAVFGRSVKKLKRATDATNAAWKSK